MIETRKENNLRQLRVLQRCPYKSNCISGLTEKSVIYLQKKNKFIQGVNETYSDLSSIYLYFVERRRQILSNVLSRDRGLSGLTFYTHLMKTRDLTEQFLDDDTTFTERRFKIYCEPVIQSLMCVTKNIILANSIFPINEHEVMIRRDFQTTAIGFCEHALVEMTRLIKKYNLSLKKETKAREIVEHIQMEVKYLKWWRKQNNSLMKKFRDTDVGRKTAAANSTGIKDAEAMLAISKSQKEDKIDEREAESIDIILKVERAERPIFTIVHDEHKCNDECRVYPECPIEYQNNRKEPKRHECLGSPIIYLDNTSTTTSKNEIKNTPSKRKRKVRTKATNFFDKAPISEVS